MNPNHKIPVRVTQFTQIPMTKSQDPTKDKKLVLWKSLCIYKNFLLVTHVMNVKQRSIAIRIVQIMDKLKTKVLIKDNKGIKIKIRTKQQLIFKSILNK
jgi:hypothetical protein